MKKRIPQIMACIWLFVVAAIAVVDVWEWKNEKVLSQYQDACIKGSKVFLTESLEDDSVLYIMNDMGDVENVAVGSDYDKESMLSRITYEDKLYGVFEKEITGVTSVSYEYRIVEFSEKGSVTQETPVLLTEQVGKLTGFTANDTGFFMTLILEEGSKAAVYHIEKELLAEKKVMSFSEQQKEEPEPITLKVLEMELAGEGLKIVAADYPDSEFVVWRNDGTGAEEFSKDEELKVLYARRELSVFQYLKIFRTDAVLYVVILIMGFVAIALASMMLPGRNHIVYTIVVVECVLFVITLFGALIIPRLQNQMKEQESTRFGYYYMETMAEALDSADTVTLSAADTYFSDICVIQMDEEKVMSSASGRNGAIPEDLFTTRVRDVLDALRRGERKATTTMKLGGQPAQLFGVTSEYGSNPKIVLLGVKDHSENAAAFRKMQVTYLVYAEIIFLIGSVISILVLLWQERELKALAAGMKSVAGRTKDYSKGSIHSKDITGMWNSLMETEKIIERINYTKYQVFESCYRFAPKNIERILGKDSITEVKGGDSVYINGTTAIISSEDMEDSGKITSDMVNRLISILEKHREEREGFFVSGQGNLSRLKILFLEATKDTLQFGISLLHETRGIKEVEGLRTSVLLHHAKYLYGIAGTEKQSFPFLISKELREVESFAKWFQKMNVRMVITESVNKREGKTAELRYIGYINISSTGKRLNLYEVLDACPVEERQKKQATMNKFSEALRLLGQYDFYLARSMFSDVLKENPQDKIAKWYLFTCEKYLNETRLPEDVCALQRDIRFAENN